MNKTGLIENVVSTTGYQKKDVSNVVDATLEAITEALSNGENVALLGFGIFEVRERSARKGRNPQTGEELEIAATKVPAFKAAKKLKELVKQ